MSELEYKFINQDGERRVCDSCGYPAPLHPFPRPVGTPGDPRLLCKLCSATRAGTATQYPDQYRGQAATLETICYVGNCILDALGQLKEEP